MMRWIIAASVLLLAPTLAHAQTWQQYQLGEHTYTQGQDQHGQPWTSDQYPIGGWQMDNLQSQDGVQLHCASYPLGNQEVTQCW